MPSRVLVAYATRYGSTGEVAEAIAERLRQRGDAADVRPAREVQSLEGYDAVVLGSPLYIGKLLKDAVTFLGSHRDALTRLPVAVFALGPIRREEGLDDACVQLDEALARLPWLEPVSKQAFVGKYDPSKLHFADKMIAKLPASPLHGVEAHDERDWPAVDAWADEMASTLG